jgi:hypothetical protein
VAIAAVVLLLQASPGAGAAETPESGMFTVDLGSPDTVIQEHTGRITWHLTGDNIVHPSVEVAWYSSYLGHAGTLGGRVFVDLDTGTLNGEITEQWTCGSDCQGWEYRDATLTATITDGRARWESGELLLSGGLIIAYHARGGSNETPSQCGNTECYVCDNRFCTFDRTGTGTADLVGWVDGDTVSLAFADRLAADPSQMDVSGLAGTEYFMSRFSVTAAGLVPSGGTTESTTLSAPEVTVTTADVDLPSVGSTIPGLIAGSPLGPADAGGEEDETTTTTVAAAPAGGGEDDETGIGGLILLVAIVGGVAAAVALVKLLLRHGPLQEAARRATERREAAAASKAAKEWFNKTANYMIEPGHTVYVFDPDWVADIKSQGKEIPPGIDDPIPPTIELAPPYSGGGVTREAVVQSETRVVWHPDHPDMAVLPTGAWVQVRPWQLTPLGFHPADTLIGKGVIEGETDDGRVLGYAPGTKVMVIKTQGDQTLVQTRPNEKMWVPRDSIAPRPPTVTASAEFTPPPPPAPEVTATAEFTPPPPPPPPPDR